MVLRHFPLDILTGKEHVHELAVGGARPHLLNLAHLRLEAAVDPGQHLVPGNNILIERKYKIVLSIQCIVLSIQL